MIQHCVIQHCVVALTLSLRLNYACRDPDKRPSAKEALKHPWLQGNSSERSIGKQLDVSVVARIQRFAQNNRFKRGVLRLIAEELLSRPGAMAAESALAAEAANSRYAAPGSPSARNPIIQDPNSKQMEEIYRKLELTGDAVDRETAAVALARMGYKLEPSEIGRLLEQVDTSNSGKVRRAALAASQIDWRYLQQNRVSDWLEIAHRAFASLDKDSDGRLAVEEIISSLKAKLPPDELRLTVQQAMQEAGHESEYCCQHCRVHRAFVMLLLAFLKCTCLCLHSCCTIWWPFLFAEPYLKHLFLVYLCPQLAELICVFELVAEDADHMDFEGFLRMLKVGSVDSLDQYDARWDRPTASPSVGSIDRLQSLLDVSQHGSDGGSTRNRGLYAGVSNVVSAGPASATTVSVYPSDQLKDYKDKSWNKPAVNFKFDFGNEFMGHKLKSDGGHAGPPQTQGAPDTTPTLVVPTPSAGNTTATTASNHFTASDSRVRGGSHFDKRMHGASLYRNAMLTPAGSGSLAARPLALPTVRE